MRIEISHDTIAKKVFDKVQLNQTIQTKLKLFVLEKYGYYKETKQLLSREDLNYINPYLTSLVLEPEELNFILKSKKKVNLSNRLVVLSLVILLVCLVEACIRFQDLVFFLNGFAAA